MNYVVKYRDSDCKWLVKGFDNDKVSGDCDSKGDAVSHALNLTRNSGGSYIMFLTREDAEAYFNWIKTEYMGRGYYQQLIVVQVK